MSDLEERVRLRIREEMTRKNLSQRDVSGILGGPGKHWSQSRVAKLLTGRVEFGLADMEALCFAIGLPIVEAVRDQGLEFLAEMDPVELRVLQRLRELDEAERSMFLHFLDVRHLKQVKHAGKAPRYGPKFGKTRPRR